MVAEDFSHYGENITLLVVLLLLSFLFLAYRVIVFGNIYIYFKFLVRWGSYHVALVSTCLCLCIQHGNQINHLSMVNLLTIVPQYFSDYPAT